MSLDAEDIRNEKVKVRTVLPCAQHRHAGSTFHMQGLLVCGVSPCLCSDTQVRLHPSLPSLPLPCRTLFSCTLRSLPCASPRPPTSPPPCQVLRFMKVVTQEDVVVGQYRNKGNLPGYLDDATVPKGSLTPTFAAVAMFSEWQAVAWSSRLGFHRLAAWQAASRP